MITPEKNNQTCLPEQVKKFHKMFSCDKCEYKYMTHFTQHCCI